jgi:mannose-6-phosphate isomerase-like protein (cupin superfamily)
MYPVSRIQVIGGPPMAEVNKYSIDLEIKLGYLRLIDVPTIISKVTDEWSNQTLCEVNDCVVRLGVFKKGEFHWHKHDKEDEFFFVLEGRFVIELEGETITLLKHQGFTIPKGVLHKTSAPVPTSILMLEAATVKPTGD